MEIPSEDTFQSTSQEIDNADSDVSQRLNRFTETIATSTNEVSEATNVSEDNSEEDSVLVVSQEG